MLTIKIASQSQEMVDIARQIIAEKNDKYTPAMLDRLAQDETELRAEAEKPFPFENELDELKARLRNINKELGMQ